MAEGFQEICEGQAKVLFPSNNEVFYNPVQEFNRDLSCAVIQQYVRIRQREAHEKELKREGQRTADAMGEATAAIEREGDEKCDDDAPKKGISVFEALSATGLRSIRYFKEIDGLDHVVANDVSADAVVSIERNIRHNGMDPVSQVIPNHDDAIMALHKRAEPKRTRYDVIDLDPYGAPTPFLDAAIRSIADGGLLAVTCTDMAVLAGNHGETCFAKYGSYPLKGKFCHEMVGASAFFVQ